MFVTVLSDKPELREKFCKEVLAGKESSKNDLSIYSLETGGRSVWLIDPAHYPEKITSLLHALTMSDYVVLLVDGLSPKVGELIVAINAMRIEKGVIVSSIPLPLGGTVLDKYEKVADLNGAKEKLLGTVSSISPASENLIALVDSALAVKSVGNVAKVALRGGIIKKNDKLFILPNKSEIEVRSIHVPALTSDSPGTGSELESTSAISRIDVAYRGELFERGILVPLRNEFQIETVVNGRFNKSPFFKDELKGRVHAYSNMQYVEGTVTENDLTLLSPLAFEKGESILIVDASNQKLRIAGVFQSKW